MADHMLQQEADMRQMRTDHEAEIMRLIFEAADAGPGELAGVISRMRASITPLMDAAYGPVRASSTVMAIKFPKPACVICGASVTEIGPFCEDCLHECPECDGSGFVAEPRTNGGQDAVESPCGRCS